MKKINKIFIVPVVLLLWILGFSFADNSDCWIFAIDRFINTWDANNSFQIVKSVRWRDDFIYSNFLTVEQQTDIIDIDSLNTAILNLKKYCCEKELWWLSFERETCKADKNSFNPNSLDSPYLFDHLFDVIMRRLNWLTWENDIYVDTKMTVDEKWAERRSRITEKAEDLSGSDVQSIIDKYKEFWKYNLKYDIASQMDAQFWDAGNDDFLKYVIWSWWKESEEDIANALRNYKDWSMYDRYHNACALSQYFYALMNVWIKSDDRIRSINKSARWLCNDAVKQQIVNENRYIWLVAQKEWNRFLYNFVNGYISYLHDRRNTLRETQKDIHDRLLDIAKKVPHLVKSCVK